MLSAAGSIIYAELRVSALSQFTIAFNTGELYNSNILGYAGVTLGMAALSIAYNILSDYGAGKVTLRARSLIWRKIIRLPANIFDKEQPSTFISRITSDIPQASTTITYICLFVSSLYGFARTFIILFTDFSVNVSLWLLFVIPIAVTDFWVCGRVQYIAYKRIYAAINRMMAFFSEHLAAIKHSKAQVMEEEEIRAGFEAIEARFKADVLNSFMTSVQVAANLVYTRTSFLILVFAGRREINKGNIDSIAAGYTYLENVQQYLAEILTQYQTIKGVQAVLGRVADLAETEVEDGGERKALSLPQADIRLQDVSFGYSEDTEVLHNISLVIPAGKKTAIVGDNGCGKSTLFKLIMRFYRPTSGTIYYGDKPAEEFGLAEWRTSFGYVLQNSPLLAGTIKENICYGLDREVSEAELISAAKTANAYDFIMNFPEGFDKDVGEGGAYLSGGQRQRIAIARAVITNPRVMLMDEATASLDYESDRLVWEAMCRLMEGRTTILIAHDMGAVVTADNIVVMKDGRIEAVGTHSELLEKSEVYRGYIELYRKKEGTK